VVPQLGAGQLGALKGAVSLPGIDPDHRIIGERLMLQRTALVVRAGAIGFGLGFILACVTIIRANPLPAPGVMVGQLVGCIAGATLIAGIIGYIRSRTIPADAPALNPISRPRLIVLGACLVLIVVLVGAFIAMLPSRPAPQTAAALSTTPMAGHLVSGPSNIRA
jgi:hypothetical protein